MTKKKYRKAAKNKKYRKAAKNKYKDKESIVKDKAKVFPQYELLPKDIRILIMSSYSTLPELAHLSMTNKANRKLVEEMIRMAAKTNFVSRQFRCAGLDTFIHTSFASAEFLQHKGMGVPKEKIRPYSEKYYSEVASAHARASQAYDDYNRELQAATLLAHELDEEGSEAFWDDWIELLTEKFPDIIFEEDFHGGGDPWTPILPDCVECCCTLGDMCSEDCGCMWNGSCFYMYHACDHFDYDEFSGKYCNDFGASFCDCCCPEHGCCVCFDFHSHMTSVGFQKTSLGLDYDGYSSYDDDADDEFGLD